METNGKLDHLKIIRLAWQEFDDRHEVKNVFDVSAHVSTNHVYKISFYDREPVFAKLSEYGSYEAFKEDHIIINNLANNLEDHWSNFLAKSLVKKNELYIYRYFQEEKSAWVVFYNPIRIRHKLPRRLDDKQVRKMGRELARFHRACTNVSNQLPRSSKNVMTDMWQLIKTIDKGKICRTLDEKVLVKDHCEAFLKAADRYNYLQEIETMPVFVDWNIGNFSVNGTNGFYSRWDYDWFRESTRVMDFYFFSRVVSDIGDRTVFSYLVDNLNEDRFIMFLKEYHKVFPLSVAEVKLIKECYRFFILNYVIKDGKYFFLPSYAQKLYKEAIELYLPTIETNYDENKLLKALKL